MTGGSWRTISVALRADTSGFSAPLLRASQGLKVFEKDAERSTAGAASKAKSGWAGFGKAVGLGVAGLAVGFAAFTAKAVSSSIEFEKRISAIGAVSGATGSQLDQMRAKALQLGADTVFSATDAAMAMEELAKAGISTKDILGGAADATVALAAAGEVALPEAARIAANAMNAFGLSAREMPRVADLISGAANASAIDVQEFGFALQQSGAVAHLAGIPFSDLSVAIAELGNAGIKGQDAGTSLKSMFLQLSPQTKRASTAMSELGIITKTGANRFFDATGKARSLSDIQGVLKQSMQGLSKEQQIVALKTIFGTDAMRAAAIMAQNGSKGFDKLATSMGKVKAADVAKKRMDNLAGSLEQLRGSLDTLLIKSGSVFTTALRGLVDGATAFVNALADPPKGFFDPLLSAGRALAPIWDALVGAGRNIAHILSTMFDAAKPVVTLFAQIAGAAIIGGLQAIATALEAVTGFLARNEPLVRALTSALLILAGVKVFEGLAFGASKFALMLGNMTTSVGNFAAPVLNNLKTIGGGFMQLRTNASGGFAAIKSGLSGLSNPAGFALLAGGLSGLIQMMQSSSRAADEMVASATQNIDTSNIDTWRSALGKLNTDMRKAQHDLKKDNFIVAWAKQIDDLATNAVGIDVIKDSAHDAANALKKASDSTDEWAAHMGVVDSGVASLTRKILGMHGSIVPMGVDAKKIGAVNAELFDLAQKNNIDLTKPFREWGPKLQDAYNKVHKVNLTERKSIVADAKLIGLDLAKAVKIDPKELKKQADELRKFIQGVHDAVASTGDLISISPDQLKFGQAGIAAFFKNAIDKAQEFTRNIQIAANKGLDPQLIGRLLAAGPEKAGEILKTVIAGTGTQFVNQVNLWSREMERQSAIAADQARLVQVAMKHGQEGARDLGLAMQINIRTAVGGKEVTAEDLANQMGISPAKVKQVARDFKLHLAQEMPKDVPAPHVGLDTKEAQDKLSLLGDYFGFYEASKPTTKALLDITDPVERHKRLMILMDIYAARNPNTSAFWNTLDPETKAKVLELLAVQWEQSNPSTNALLGIDPARLGFTTLTGYAEFYKSLSPSTIADLKHKPADVAFAILHLKAVAWQREKLDRTAHLKFTVDPFRNPEPFATGPTKSPPKQKPITFKSGATFDEFFAGGFTAAEGFEKGVDAKVKSWGKGGPGHKIAAEAMFGTTDTLESHSPSRAMARIGVDAALGFIVGLGSLTPVAAATAGATGLAVGAAFASSVAPAFTAATLSVTGTVLAGLGAMTGAAAASASATGLAVGAAFQSTVVPAFDVAMLTVSTGVLAGLGTLAAVGSAASSATGLAIGLAFATTVVPAFDQANQAVLASTQRMLDAHALLWQLGTFRVLTIVTQFGMAVVAAVDSIYQPTTDAFQRTLDTMQVQAQVGGALIAGTLNSTLAAGVGAVAATMKVYGATLVGALNPILTGIGAKTITTIAQPFAFGGRVPGTGRGDKVPAMLEPDEVVIRNRSGDKFGRRNLLDLNDGKVPPGWKIPGMATGGLVGAPQKMAGGGQVAPGTLGNGWRAIIETLVGAGIPNRVISTVRPGAVTHATGQVSNHALGLAVDFTGPGGSGDVPGGMRIFRFFDALRNVNELIYSWADHYRTHGMPKPIAALNPITKADHWSHVHVSSGGGAGGGAFSGGPGGAAAAGPAPVQLPQPPDIKDHGHLGTTATLAARHTHDLAQTWADQHTALPAPTGGGSAGISTNFTGPASGGLLGRVMAAVRQHESGGNYTIQNPYGSASGAYQVLSTTWNGYGGYPTAASAPPAVQDRFAAERMGPALAQYGIGGVAGLWFVGDPTRGHDPTPVGGPGNSGSVLDYTNYLTNLSAHIAGVPGYAEGGLVAPQRFVSGGRVGSRRGMADPNTRRTEPVAPIRQPWVDRPVHLLHGKALRDDQKRQAYAKFHPEAQKGWNWKAPQKLHEQHHVTAAVKHAFPNGIIGDLNQSGHVTDREWKDYSRFLEAMRGPHKADVLQFLGRRPLHKATAAPAGHHPTPHGTKPRPTGRLDWMSNAEFALLSIANDRKHGLSDRFDRDRLRYFQVAGIGGRPFKGDMGADMYGFHVQPGGGYARPAGSGEKVTAHRRPFDDFGTLAKGWNLVQNKTGAPEKVVRDLPVPHGGNRSSAVTVSYKGGDVVVNTTGGDPKKIAAEVHKVIASDAQVIVKALERHEKTFA